MYVSGREDPFVHRERPCRISCDQTKLSSETITGLLQDNQAVIAMMAECPISGRWMKHIYARYQFNIWELVEREVLRNQYTESSNQHADILTKTLEFTLSVWVI